MNSFQLMEEEQQTDIVFEVTLGNGSICRVRYRKCYIGIPALHKRVDHFEFRGNRYISHTLYFSRSILLEYDAAFDYRNEAVRIANELAGFTQNETDVQLSLLDS